jgi:flagellar hook-length control protein FliK
LTSGVPATGAAAGATTAPQLATADSAAGAVSPQTQPNLPADLSQLLPLMSGGQPNTGGTDGNPFGDRARDRSSTVVAPSVSASTGGAAVASSADGVAGTAPLAASPGTTVGPDVNPAGGGSISDQISGRLVQLVSSGSRDMVMRLHPPDLGALTVQVTVSGRDVSAWFASPHPEVQNAISAGMGQLQADLGNAGYNLNGAWVGADASGGQRQAANPLAPPSRTPGAAVFAAAPSAVARPSTSGLNIYV